MDEETSVPRPDDLDPTSDKAIRLFQYLHELVRQRSKQIHSLDQYEACIWLTVIPREKQYCHSVLWKDEDKEQSDTWISVQRPNLKRPPRVPPDLQPWLDPRQVEDSSIEMPNLLEEIVITRPPGTNDEDTEEPPKRLHINDHPEIRELWESYVDPNWRAWQEEDQRMRNILNVYTNLYSMYQKQHKLSESYEIVLGIGYLTWRTPTGEKVDRHIVTAQTHLMFHPAAGRIEVAAAAEGTKPQLEQDMLNEETQPNMDIQKDIRKNIEELAEDIWDIPKLDTQLRAWVNAASPRGVYDNSIDKQGRTESDPRIHFAPALILRRRTERSLLKTFLEIINQLQEGQSVPPGIRGIVKIVDETAPKGFDEDPNHEGDTTRTGVEEIYFPLPYNEEQVAIVKHLSQRTGVLIEGPPGTGKSHSIVNLICHLLASGNRVLVTSETTRALSVLKEKMPQSLKSLTVNLLGDSLESMQSLEDSVTGITTKQNGWDTEHNRSYITEREKALDKVRRAQAETQAALLSLKEKETYRHPTRFGNYQGTAKQIAEQLKEEEPRFLWLQINKFQEEPPASDQEMLQLLELLHIDKETEKQSDQSLPDKDLLMAPEDFLALCEREALALEKHEELQPLRARKRYDPLLASDRNILSELLHSLINLVTKCETLFSHMQHWVKKAATDILGDHDRTWRELRDISFSLLEKIANSVRAVATQEISGLEERDRRIVRAHASALLERLKSGKKFGVWPFRPKVVRQAKYIRKEVHVEGVLCDNLASIEKLLEWINVADQLDALDLHWGPHTPPATGTFRARFAIYQDLCEPLEETLSLHNHVIELKATISKIPALREPAWHDIDDLKLLRDIIEAIVEQDKLEKVQDLIKAFELKLNEFALFGGTHPAVERIREAIATRDRQGYSSAYQTIVKLRNVRTRLARRRELFDKLSATCPDIAADLSRTFTDPIWKERLTSFTAAWNWHNADRWLKSQNDPEIDKQLLSNLEESARRIQELLLELATAKAWEHCFSTLKTKEYQHLMAWTKAVRRIGKGKGKYAPMHRTAAKEHMDQCRSAIPAWIMPLYRVAENVRPGQDAFDVVIVDEASQSGPEALFLQYLAKKIIVVGDDKQISPAAISIRRDNVELLRQKYLTDIPHSDALGVDNSFFDQAVIRYGARIQLREHFRCMPEIIGFSNSLCYMSEPLEPLRQFGAGRLTPVVSAIHVPDGYQRGKSPKTINPPEVEAIVRKIEAFCKDPAYDDKTMGVICLLGDNQAREIEYGLLDTIGPEEMHRRQLVCGNAYAFQGDERDIMFLSLVSAPINGQAVRKLSKKSDEQRFNVAASRAKDQMFLFHSATLNDLNPECLRYKLLDYCQDPKIQRLTPEDIDLDELREIAKNSRRDKGSLPQPFDSWFEVDVFLEIAKRGFRVIPQYPIANKSIDILVQGMQGRLAVECDGDAFHGTEQFEADIARQRKLERCGLHFWRIRGSTFYRDPQKSLDPLWTLLEKMNIRPYAAWDEEPETEPIAEEPEPAEEYRQETPNQEKSSRAEEDYRKAEPEKRAQPSEPDPPPWEEVARNLPGLKMSPYKVWSPDMVPDPRVAEIYEIREILTDIIAVEGPMPISLSHRIYARSCGIGRVGRQIRAVFDKALHSAMNDGDIVAEEEDLLPKQSEPIVRISSCALVVVRALGHRSFHEIPASEVFALIKNLKEIKPNLYQENLMRTILDLYGLRRMSSRIREALKELLDKA